MPDIIRIKNLQPETNLNDVVFPIDHSGYTEAKQTSISYLKDWVTSGITENLVTNPSDNSVLFSNGTGSGIIAKSGLSYDNTQLTVSGALRLTSGILMQKNNSVYFQVNPVANNSNFIGVDAGAQSTGASYSNFIGYNVGSGATNASNSNFIGNNTGFDAKFAINSNFIGSDAGYNATNANNSNFIGNGAGGFDNSSVYATNASYSNFIGAQTGAGASGASFSNFIGYRSGYDSFNSKYSNFIGFNAGGIYNLGEFYYNGAGLPTTDAAYSNFIGSYAGVGASYSNNSNFIGNNTGLLAINSSYSNFIGESAGSGATNSSSSNFIGYYAGANAITANLSNFMGYQAGYGATNANNSNFIGYNSGNAATLAALSNFIGYKSGNAATSATLSNFIGYYAGFNATTADHSNFIGINAGYSAITANYSNFIGYQAGFNATNANNSIFIGRNSGYDAINANNSIFIGNYAGAHGEYHGTGENANNSIFIGYYAGSGASGATYSNFIGEFAGANATNSTYSNFIGYNAGGQFFNMGPQYATDTPYSNFIGYYAGAGAINATYSNIIGYHAGFGSTGASYSTLIGYNAGSTNIGSNNIIIGTNVSLPLGQTNSINIGGVLFGVNTYSTTSGDPSIVPSTNGRIGINVVNPQATLHINNTSTGYTFLAEDSSYPDLSPFIINKAGDVLIGTLSNLNNYKLIVSGNTNIIGDIYVGEANTALLTGTLTSNGSPIIIGNGTNFTDFSVGDIFKQDTAPYYTFTILSIFNDTNLTATTSVQPYTEMSGSMIRNSQKNVNLLSANNGSVTISGVTKTLGFMTGYVEKTSNYTGTTTDHTIYCPSGTLTITLPNAVSSIVGKQYVVKSSSTSVVTVKTSASQLIDGVSSFILQSYQSMTFVSTGSSWIIVNSYAP